jgi:hypothetical protein
MNAWLANMSKGVSYDFEQHIFIKAMTSFLATLQLILTTITMANSYVIAGLRACGASDRFFQTATLASLYLFSGPSAIAGARFTYYFERIGIYP